MTSEEFIRIVCADQPDTPDYFTYDAILNTKQHPPRSVMALSL